MEILPARDAATRRGGAERFTGSVELRNGPDGLATTSVAVVRFEAGARTHWHSHPGGQVLYVVEGIARVRSRGTPGALLGAGDLVFVPPGEEHFHGADPAGPMTHLAVNGGGGPDWGAAVTDEEFSG